MIQGRRVVWWVFGAVGVYGVVLAGGFVAMRFGWTHAKSAVDERSAAYDVSDTLRAPSVHASAETPQVASDGAEPHDDTDTHKQTLLCALQHMRLHHAYNARLIAQSYIKTGNMRIAEKMIRAVSLAQSDQAGENITDGPCASGEERTLDIEMPSESEAANMSASTVFPWMNTEEWQALRSATVKDAQVINRAATVAGVEPRMLVACLVAEQTRLFHASRALFKQVFQPLKILGNATQFSLGVMGMKEGTARETEEHLADPQSPFFPGSDLSFALPVPAGADPDALRVQRLTDDRDHYYNYLYAALYIREINEQWKRAGFPITYRPEIIGTLYNVGFRHSHPKEHPEVGGAIIQAGDRTYTFGALVYEFYYSGELLDTFPYVTE